MATDQSRSKWQEVPLGARGCENLFSIYSQAMEYEGEFVDQCDVYISLRVLNHFRSFGDSDATGQVSTRSDYLPIELIYEFGSLRRRSGCDFSNTGQSMLLVARIHSLGTVTGEEIDIESQARDPLENGYADLFRAARVHRGLIHDDVSFLEQSG